MSKVYAYEVYKDGELVYQADQQNHVADFLEMTANSVNYYCKTRRAGYHIEDRSKEDGFIEVYRDGELVTKVTRIKDLKGKLGLSLSEISAYNALTKKGIEIVEPETQTIYAYYYGDDTDTLLMVGTAEDFEEKYGMAKERLDYQSYQSVRDRLTGIRVISWEERVE